MPRLLVVDDEVSIQRTLGALLRAQGYDVDVAGSGRDALDAVRYRAPDVIVLDLGLPDRPGLDVCRDIRSETAAPIVVLSARGDEAGKVAALDLGADDYVTKPFGSDEFLARIRVALRRSTADHALPDRITLGTLTVDLERRRVVRGDDDIRLTPKEFELLALLARNMGRVLTHKTILRSIWGPHAVRQPEHLWVLVSQLRRKIESDPVRPRYLLSEPWVGYRLVPDSNDA